MAVYKCFQCEKKIKSAELTKKFCPYCGSRIFYKPRLKMKSVGTN